jgi:diadenosine tetraphosphate (Ap4A) HIT family hydrolase
MTFHLDPRLESDGFDLLDLKLSKVIFVDNAHFPWIILVPQRENLKEIIDLSKEDRYTLMDEINLVSVVMQEVFWPDKLNVAALGNVVSQLHIHIVARFANDIAFPQPVFGKERKPYELAKREELKQKLREALKRKGV